MPPVEAGHLRACDARKMPGVGRFGQSEPGRHCGRAWQQRKHGYRLQLTGPERPERVGGFCPMARWPNRHPDPDGAPNADPEVADP